MPRNLVIVLGPRMNPLHSHKANELPMFDGITVSKLVMTVAPQKAHLTSWQYIAYKRSGHGQYQFQGAC